MPIHVLQRIISAYDNMCCIILAAAASCILADVNINQFYVRIRMSIEFKVLI